MSKRAVEIEQQDEPGPTEIDRRQFVRKGLLGTVGVLLGRLLPALKSVAPSVAKAAEAWLKSSPEMLGVEVWTGEAWQTFSVWAPKLVK